MSQNPLEQAQTAFSSLIKKLQEAQTKKFTFLLVGRTGVGKSSTVNSLMGKEIARVGHYEATTMGVESYNSEISGIEFTVIDTPGLCDDFEEEGNDEKYLELMHSTVKQIDSMWFVSRLDETRVTADEKRGIRLISEALSPEIWKHAVIVFTYANSVDTARYSEALNKRTELIRKEISKYADSKVANEIPSVAVDNMVRNTPDGEEWLGELYATVFSRISERGVLPFLMATAGGVNRRFSNGKSNTESNWAHSEVDDLKRYGGARINLNDKQKKVVKQKMVDARIVSTLAIAGGSIGSVFGPAGAAIGGAVGAAVGLVKWLFS